MLRKNAKIELIASVPLFERCSKSELQQVAGIADELNVRAERTLTREGTTGREFLVLVEGRADVHQGGRRINALGPGDFLGEIALITGAKRTATVTTTEPSRLLVITARDFKALLRRVPSMQLKVLEALAERLPQDV